MATLNADLIVPGDKTTTLRYAVDHFITCSKNSISDHGSFFVALSGGSTPREVYELLTSPPFVEEVEWEKVHLFWSDERAVPPESKESNYHMAMKAGFEKVDILPQHIHRMPAEKEIQEAAKDYENTIRQVLQERSFDLILLGMGEDGHTASLFPETSALNSGGRLVLANYIPKFKSWRMTLTLECLNSATHCVFYVLGDHKKEMLTHVFSTPPTLPCQLVGSSDNPALWITDSAASPEL